MTKRLQGRVAIVNGGGSSGPGWGNGKCTAVQFAREGAQVVVVDINRAAAEETAALIAGEGGKALVIQADVTSESDMQDMVARTLSEYGRLDILAQIVGISSRLTFFEETEADWDRVMAVNVKAAFLSAPCRAQADDRAAMGPHHHGLVHRRPALARQEHTDGLWGVQGRGRHADQADGGGVRR